MTTKTAIEWADYSLNPGIYGCTEVSRACLHCYAATMAHRQVAMGNYPEGITTKRASGVHWSGVVKCDEAAIAPAFAKLPTKPHRDGRPRRVFVTSMADVFHADVPDDHIGEVFREMRARPHLIFMVLTKRPERAAEWIRQWAYDRWPDNVWAGTTVEHQAAADERIPELLQVPAKVRFLSCEPMVGAIGLTAIPLSNPGALWPEKLNALTGEVVREIGRGAIGFDTPARLSWVIAGGESGRKAAPSHPEWFRSLRDQCKAAGVPFFMKQMGSAWPDKPKDDPKGGQWASLPEDLRIREVPA